MLRGPIDEKLQNAAWFQASEPGIQDLLLTLPTDGDQDCSGYLADLAKRPEVSGGVKLRRILEVLIPRGRIFGIFTNFEVEHVQTGAVFGYQYFSWRHGPQSGAKGLAFIQDKHRKLTHAVVLYGYSFAAGRNVVDVPGGFAEANESGIEGMITRFKTELREEIGVPDLKIAKVIPLGSIYLGHGMTNNRPEAFVAILDASEANKIPVGEHRNPDPHEMRSVPCILPLDRFWGEDGLVARSEDGFFLACVARLVALGILKP